MNYGVPYVGSKNRIASQLIDAMPRADYFVDLFAGGCAMTHAALLSGKYKYVIANDITDAPMLFYNAVKGKYHNETRWISRDDFFRQKDTDLYVRYCWSFGNNGKGYLYGKDIEPYKKALHYAIVFRDYTLLDNYSTKLKEIIDAPTIRERRLNMIKDCGALLKIIPSAVRLCDLPFKYTEKCKKNNTVAKKCDILNFIHLKSKESLQNLERLERLQTLEMLESLQNLERLQSLERLESLHNLERLQIYKKDYREIFIPENSVVYCDPPYKGTVKYLNEFDSRIFFEWVKRQDRAIFFSEYNAPGNFTLIKEIKTSQRFSSNGQSKSTERLFGWNIEKKEYKQLSFNI